MSEEKKYWKQVLESDITASIVSCPKGKEYKEKHKYLQVVEFSSAYDMITKLERCVKQYKWDGKGQEDERYYEHDNWTYGSLTKSQTRENLIIGMANENTKKKAQEIREKLLSSPKVQNALKRADSMKRRRVFKEEGAELCIDRILCGEPEHWAKMQGGRKIPVVKIGINIAGNCTEDENHFTRTVAVAGVVADLLQAAGFHTHIVSAAHSEDVTNISSKNVTIVDIKKPTEQLDIERLLSVGCSGFFREWHFRVYYNVLYGIPGYGLGRTVKMTKAIQKYLNIDYMIDNNFSSGGKALETCVEDMFDEVVRDKVL